MDAALALVIVLAIAAALFSALVDAALLGLDPEDEAAEPRVAVLVAGRERAHRTLSFVRLVAYVVAGMATVAALGIPFGGFSARQVLALVAIATLAAIAEGAARAVGDASSLRVALATGGIVRLLEIPVAPVARLGEAIDARLGAWLPVPLPTEQSREVTAEQFYEVVAAEAEVTGGQEALLHRVFELGDTEVREIMVPRIDIVGVEQDAPWSEVVDRVRSSEHARIPVYRESVDEVVGMLYAKDLLPAVVAGEPPASGWQTLIRSTLFIPPTKPVDEQLREFRATGTHIAIVVDEYGGTAGLVTIEDILEELVGEIRDEYDEEAPEVEQEDGSRWWVSARLTLDDLSELIGHDFRREGITTVGGLVYDLLGRVPRAGEELAIDNYRVIVERVVKRRVQRVYFERHDPSTDDADIVHVEDHA